MGKFLSLDKESTSMVSFLKTLAFDGDDDDDGGD